MLELTIIQSFAWHTKRNLQVGTVIRYYIIIAFVHLIGIILLIFTSLSSQHNNKKSNLEYLKTTLKEKSTNTYHAELLLFLDVTRAQI